MRGVRSAQWNLEIAQAQYNGSSESRNVWADIELAQQDLVGPDAITEIKLASSITRTLLGWRLHDQLNDARIVAPFDGVIVVKHHQRQPGQGYKTVMSIAIPRTKSLPITETPS